MDIVADTSFYIDFQRKRQGPAEWILSHPQARLVITPITYAELLVGQPDEAIVNGLVGNASRLVIDFDVAREYARVTRHIPSQRRMIGPNDLWIAVVAYVNGLPVLTRNVGEFERVPGLKMETYRS